MFHNGHRSEQDQIPQIFNVNFFSYLALGDVSVRDAPAPLPPPPPVRPNSQPQSTLPSPPAGSSAGETGLGRSALDPEHGVPGVAGDGGPLLSTNSSFCTLSMTHIGQRECNGTGMIS